MKDENSRPLIMGAINPIPRGVPLSGPGLSMDTIKPRAITRPAGVKPKRIGGPAITSETAKPPVRIPRPETLFNPEAAPVAPAPAPVPAPRSASRPADPGIPPAAAPAGVQAKTSTKPMARRSSRPATSRAGARRSTKRTSEK